jgi:4-hydroxy-tetrahydrodipicolinate synthase
VSALGPGQLRGSYPPLVTPLRRGRVDYDAFAQLVELHAAQGSHGVVVCGTTGEPSTLTADERARLVEVAVRTAAGRLPVVAATGSDSHAQTAELCVRAEKAGADALLVVTPYYLRPPQRGLVEYYADLGARSQLPTLLYHIPGRSGAALELDTIERIVARVPHVVGIKWAVADLDPVSDMLARLGPDWRVFVGLESLSFPMLCVGAAGVMNAAGNIAPARVAALCERVAAGDLGEARRLHFELLELFRAIFWDTNPIPLKYMMRRIGILATNEHRLPMVPATPELERRLDDALRRAGLI